MKWTSIKPTFKEDCLFIAASKFRGQWDYTLFEIKNLIGEEGSYLGWLKDGEEYGDIEDLSAHRYLILKKIL